MNSLNPISSTNIKQLFSRYKIMALLIAIAIIWAFFSWKTEGGFVTPRNLSNLLRQMSVTGILACGMVLVIIAGEIDLFEALAHVRKHYPIDADRVLVRGFSMGGAACWQFAVHHAGLWAAAAPGAGFSETADFLKVFQNEPVQPTWYEKKIYLP